MISRISINHKLEKLREYTGYLKNYQKHSLTEIQQDHTLQGALLHYLQLSIESVLDTAELVISEKKLRKPQEAREALSILGEQHILPEDFAAKLMPMASFRNILVHEYAEVDLARVHHFLQHNLTDFDTYAKHIAAFLTSPDKQ